MSWQANNENLFIGGRWIASTSGQTLTVTSPYTARPIATVAAASPADVDQAVASARQAFDLSDWARSSLEDRMKVLRGLSERMGARQEEIASLVTAEMGCPITLSRSMQAGGPKVVLDTFLEMARDYPWADLREAATGRAMVYREPVGVVAAVVPWNAPLLISVIKLAPALLAGCAVVLKPAPQTPLDAYLLAEMLADAGLPDGVLSVLPADREVSEYLVTHPGIDKVAFTGSTAAGRRIASLCGNDLKRVTLELGGKSAAVLLDDADLGAAAEALRVGSFRNSGQVCSLKTRIVVPRSRAAEFLDAFTSVIASMPVGDPADPDTQIGPMVSARQRDRVEGYIAAGREQGARVILGGGRPDGLGAGWFVEPTVFAGVERSMTIAQEEIFGPVVSVLAYEDEDEAVAIANDSAYGLNGSVFTSDPERGLAVARRIRTGTVEINGNPVGFRAPIGGFKSSGIGREAGPEGFDAYTEIKSVGLPQGFTPAA